MIEGSFFPKVGKWLTPTIKEKKVTYSNTSLKIWKERKYAIELIPVKKILERSCIFCGKDSKRYHKSFIKASKVVFTMANASIYSNVSKYSRAIKACKKFAPVMNV